MTDEQLPSELERLEQELVARSRPMPSAALRQRVLDELRVELASPVESVDVDGRRGRHADPTAFGNKNELRPRQQKGSLWAFAAGLAAVALLWLNLSMSATQATDFHLRIDGDGQSIDTVLAELQQLVPELSDRDARREAILLQTSTHIVPCPSLPTSHRANQCEPNLGRTEFIPFVK